MTCICNKNCFLGKKVFERTILYVKRRREVSDGSEGFSSLRGSFGKTFDFNSRNRQPSDSSIFNKLLEVF